MEKLPIFLVCLCFWEWTLIVLIIDSGFSRYANWSLKPRCGVSRTLQAQITDTVFLPLVCIFLNIYSNHNGANLFSTVLKDKAQHKWYSFSRKKSFRTNSLNLSYTAVYVSTLNVSKMYKEYHPQVDVYILTL